MNITIVMSVSFKSINHMDLRAVAKEPLKKKKGGFVIQQIGTHRIGRKTIPYQEIYVN